MVDARSMLGLGNTRPSMQYQQVRQFASAYPTAFAQAAGSALLAPTSSQRIVDQGDLAYVQTDTANPLSGTTTQSMDNLVQRRAPTDARTSAMKNAEAKGLLPGTAEYNAFIDKSSSGITVNTGNKKAGDAIVTTLTGLADSATSARQTMSRVEQMSGLLDAGLVTGFGAETVNNLRRVGQFFNPSYKLKEVAGAEAFIGNANAMIGPLVKQLGSNPTDKDLKFFETASPTVTKTVEGNKLLLKGLKLQSARQVALSEAAQNFMLLPENKDIDGFTGLVRLQRHLSNFVNTNPIFKQAGKLLLDEYTKLNGSPPPSTSGSALDDLIDLGLVAN